jgi:hypothetical protein
MSHDRYSAAQNGQSPDDYGPNVGAGRLARTKRASELAMAQRCQDVGGIYTGGGHCAMVGMGDADMGADSGDPCDASSAYYDENACYNSGGNPYDSGSSNPYGAPTQGNQPVDAAFCDSLVTLVPMPPPPVKFQGAQAEQMYRSQMEGYYNFLNSMVVKRTLIAPNGNFSIPFRTVQVNNSGRVYDDFYTNENHQILLFADTNSAEWQNAGLDRYCPSYVGLPTGQCQDIPGQQCQMSGMDIMMGEDFVLGASAPVVRHVAAKSAKAASKQGSVVWRKMTPAENARQKARYRAGGTSRAQQTKVAASARAKAALASRPTFNRAKSSSPYSHLRYGKPGVAVSGTPPRRPPIKKPCPAGYYRNSAGGCNMKFY